MVHPKVIIKDPFLAASAEGNLVTGSYDRPMLREEIITAIFGEPMKTSRECHDGEWIPQNPWPLLT